MTSSKHIHKNASFLKRTFLSFIAVTIVVTILLTGFLTFNYMKTSQKLIYNSNANILAQSNYSITYINELAQRLSKSLYSDNDIIAFLNADKAETMLTVRASQTLDKHLLPLTYVDSVYLYNPGIDMFVSTQNGYQNKKDEFYDQQISTMITDPSFIKSYDSKPIIHDVMTKSGIKKTCSYVTFTADSKTGLLSNALIINISVETLTQSLHSLNKFSNEMGMRFLIVDNSGELLFDDAISSDSTEKKQILNEISKTIKNPNGEPNKTVAIEGTEYLMSYDNNNPNSWYIFSIIPQKTVFKDVTYSSIVSMIIVIILFLLTALVCLILARQLNNPIKIITKMVNGQNIDSESLSSIKTDEFKFLTSVFQTMKEQNDQFYTFKNETEYSMKQDMLNNLVSGNLIQSLEKTTARLESFNLSYLAKNRLCMCILKIDDYEKFYSTNNQRERWALRYAIVNVASEISGKCFTSETFSTNSDKFVMIIKCDETTEFKEFKQSIQHMLEEIGSSMKENLSISISMAYSTIFKGLEHIASMHKNLEELIQMKMKYGHGCIISPYMLDEVETEHYQIPLNDEEALMQKINAGQQQESLKIYKQISKQLFKYSYNEVISYVIHLSYTIYATVLSKNVDIKQDSASILKTLMINLQKCEVFSDIDSLMSNFICYFCERLNDDTKNEENMQNNDLITQRICDIIEKEYNNNALCLSSIADYLELSPNYIGHVFKSVRNMSISKYISDFRMKKVAEYLANTKLPLADIVEKVGMEKNNYFYTCFKRNFGMSLSDYKKNVLKQK